MIESNLYSHVEVNRKRGLYHIADSQIEDWPKVDTVSKAKINLIYGHGLRINLLEM